MSAIQMSCAFHAAIFPGQSLRIANVQVSGTSVCASCAPYALRLFYGGNLVELANGSRGWENTYFAHLRGESLSGS